MNWKSAIKKSGVNTGQLSKQFSAHVMKKMMSDLESEGYEEMIHFPAMYKFDFEEKIRRAIEQLQERVDNAVLNNKRFDSNTKERFQ